MKTPAVYFFDMDHTLINNDCDVSWKQFAVRHNLAPESDLAEADRYFDDYNAGTLDVEEFYLFQFREFIGKTPEEMRPLSELHFEEYVRPHIYPEARKLVGSLLDAGFPVAILTSTNSVVAQPARGVPRHPGGSRHDARAGGRALHRAHHRAPTARGRARSKLRRHGRPGTGLRWPISPITATA